MIIDIKRSAIGGPGTLAQSILACRTGHIALIRAIDVNGLEPVIDRYFALQDIARGVGHYESQAHFGKVCIEI